MIKENQTKYERLGITKWHEKGYKGQGMSIAELEPVYPSSIFNGTLIDPFGFTTPDQIMGHGYEVMFMMHEVVPMATKYTLPESYTAIGDSISGDIVDKSLPFIKSKGIDVVGASFLGTDSKIFADSIRALHNNTIFVTAAGNDGTKGLSPFSKTDVWISVGASNLDLSKSNYSSIGEQLDCMCFGTWVIQNAKNPSLTFADSGTSFASPVVAGMCCLVQQFFKEKTGKKLSQSQMLQFIKDNCVDLGDKGTDSQYGNGFFVLPDPDNIDVSKYINEEVNEMTRLAFIEQIKPGAIKGYKQGILPSLTIAQACLESNYGAAAPGFNLFGIKWSEGCGHDKQLLPTWEVINGKEVKVNTYFRKYNSYDESIEDHTQLLMLSRYAPVRAAKDYKEACLQIRLSGYATDPAYTTKLINIIETYGLNKYDREGYKMYQDFDKVSDWAKPYVEEANKLGLMVGSDGNFNPQDNVTREQLAKVAVELYHKIKGA